MTVFGLVVSIATVTAAIVTMDNRTVDRTNTFLAALERQDLDTMAAMMDPGINFAVPMSFSGDPEPARTVVGKDQMVKYYRDGFQTIRSLEYVNVRMSVTDDGKTSFVQCNGQEVSASGSPYRNVYIYRFDWNNDLVTNMLEYTNPITFCQVFNDPSCAILPAN